MSNSLFPDEEPTVTDLDQVKRIAEFFELFNHPYRTDPFRKIHHGIVSDWYDKGYEVCFEGDWGAVVKRCKTNRDIKDFSGETVGKASVGDWECVAFAYQGESNVDPLVDYLEQRTKGKLWMTGVHQENPRVRPVLKRLNAQFVSSRISGVGGGDIWGIYRVGSLRYRPVGWKQQLCFAKIGEFATKGTAERLLRSDLSFDVTDRGKRYGGPKKTWTRVNVRMAGESRVDVRGQIENHPLFSTAPELLKVLELVAPLDDLDYTMLTKTESTEGIIARHSDIALDAKKVELGIVPGKTMRFHFVVQSNPQCVFRIWDLWGSPHDVVMETGDIWYADVRKPHEVINQGSTHRLHLMADFFADRICWDRFSDYIL